jgi:uncharacterized protein with NRDE domain
MCLIVFALNCHRDFKLILAANRDEFYDRPTASAAYWEDDQDILAGRDLRSGGTWLGVARDGRFAALTNYRDPDRKIPEPISRGVIVADYLKRDQCCVDFIQRLDTLAGRCDGFNMIFGDPVQLNFFSNRGGAPGRIRNGIHGLSNHLLDTPWPKVTKAKQDLSELISMEHFDPEDLFSTMGDATPFPDELLPDTGVPRELERQLSPLFIKGEDYGTRSTTLLFIDRKNTLTFIERSFYPTETRTFRMSLDTTFGNPERTVG